jgi:hypothetical protein
MNNKYIINNFIIACKHFTGVKIDNDGILNSYSKPVISDHDNNCLNDKYCEHYWFICFYKFNKTKYMNYESFMKSIKNIINNNVKFNFFKKDYLIDACYHFTGVIIKPDHTVIFDHNEEDTNHKWLCTKNCEFDDIKKYYYDSYNDYKTYLFDL